MKLIQLKKYLLLIDEEAEIKEWDFYYDLKSKPFPIKQSIENSHKDFTSSKIIAYYPITEEAKELDLPLLPPFPVVSKIDIQGMAIEKYGDNYWSVDRLTAFEDGYKAAQSKQLELLKRAIQLASDAENIEEVTEEIIQSLSTQQLPKNFVPEYEDVFNKTDSCSILDNNYHTHSKKLKTITNSVGKEVLVGEYKY